MLPEALGSLLHHCSKTKSFRYGFTLHAIAVKSGLHSDVVVSNHILNMYAKCGSIGFARQVFDEMSERNLVSWSALISGYDQVGQPLMAIDLFSQIQFVPNEYIYASAISACARLLALPQGVQIHAHCLKFGFSSVSFVSNSLISMYMKCGGFRDALSVFACMSDSNSVSYNAIIAGLVENRQPEKGFEVFKLMHQRGLIPDRFTLVGVLGICTTADDLWRGMELHCQTVKLNLHSTAFIGNVIITMYSKFSLIEEAVKAFKVIEEKDVISWNTIISACSHCVDYAKGLSFFKQMVDEDSARPDDFTFTSALSTCAGLASIRHGTQIHAHLIRTKVDEDVGVCNALVNMYTKSGCIRYAYTVFNQMGCRNIVSWNSIIAGFGSHGLARKSLELFEQMKENGLKTDSVTFIGLLSACNHVGLVENGQAYYNSMSDIYGVAPNIEHFSCLIDLLGRAGKLNEAEEYMKKSPFRNDQVILGSLLSACRVHGNVEIGDRLARHILSLDPVTTSPYVLLSNLYASDEMWDGVAEARKMLKGSGLKKEPGHSMIEVKGMVEKFTIGDLSHSKIKEILDVLRTFSWEGDEVSLCF